MSQVYFARGTTETPTLGTVVGPPFSAALSSQLSGKTLGFEGIAYPATVAGYLAGGDAGSATTMANTVTSKASYQGAQVTHLAARKLSTAVQNRVVAVVTFGDPYKNTALPGSSKAVGRPFATRAISSALDPPSSWLPTFTYGSDTPAAAEFVKARV
ncbi:cutinase [Coprinellus micaceus]|uniref:cutinase n=1 Tax=Coprinellus micaceus TaxID=71717 RepID=A0A4Y7RBJ8_COPMI|nr:cutinase [Coprinellus micaceus]